MTTTMNDGKRDAEQTPVAPAQASAGSAAETPARARSGSRRLIILLVVLVVLAVAGYFGYTYWIDSQRFVSTDDALVDSNLVSIAPPSSGTLEIWRVKVGDEVKAGQTLGTVKPPPGAAAYADIKAPIDGTVVRVDGKLGQVVGAAQTLAYVADLKHLTVTAFVDETQIGRVKPGQKVEISVDASGSTSYAGTVKEILPAVASQFSLIPSTDRATSNFTKVTQRVEVHIDLGDTSGMAIYPGENATVRVRVAQ